MRTWTNILSLLLCGSLSAATYYVATTGDNNRTTAQAQNISTPWQTIGKAASVVNAGDTVYVAAGTYTEYVQLTRPGTSVAPITWIGERDGDEWLTIIDGSEAMPQTGWTQATGAFTDGQRAWKRTFSYQPGLITINGLSMLEMRWSSSAQANGWWNLNKLGYASNRTTGDGIPKDGTALWWAGFESMWAYTNGIVYVRFRDESTPVGKTMRVSPRDVAWNISGASYNTIRGFNVRGGRFAMQWVNDVQGIVIEQCLIEQGHRGISATGNTRDCIIRDNVFRGSHASTRPYGPRNDSNPDHNPEYQIYSRNKFEWGLSSEGGSIGIWNPGPNNLITNNVVTNIAVGMLIEQGNNRPHEARDASGMQINFNTLRDTTHALLVGAGHGDVTIASNIIHRSHYALRFQNFNVVPANDGAYLVYGNRISSTNAVGRGLYMHAWPASILSAIGNPDTTAAGRQILWMYHNSFSGIQDALYISAELDNTGGLPRWYVINNLFSCAYALRGTSWATPMRPAGQWGGLDFNAWLTRSGSSHTILDQGPNNVVMPDYEWAVASEPDFQIASSSTARDRGINIAAPFTVNAANHAALPGYPSDYYSGLAPDIGAWEYGGIVDPPDYPLVSVTVDPVFISETSATTFTFTRSESLTGALTVNFTVGGTAVAGTDYQNDLGTSVVIADGQATATKALTGVRNTEYTGNQSVTLTIADSEDYIRQSPFAATAVIVESDVPPTSTIREQPEPGHSPLTRTRRL